VAEMAAHATRRERVASAALFARAARGYWTSVFPQVAHELGRWHERAGEISDPALRMQALEALAKRGNMEGAAAFATFVGREHRAAVVRATVAFQTAYNHLDTISEQSGPVGPEEAGGLHEALLDALVCAAPGAWAGPRGPGESGRDYERPIHPKKNEEDGYLTALVEVCQEALGELPSYELVAPAARRAAERVVCFQACNAGELQAMGQWARTLKGLPRSQAASDLTPADSDLRWWETAASGGSSLGVHAMIAAAAEPGIDQAHVDALERAYFPWIGALHSMLDHLVDIEEDARTGQNNLIGQYSSPAEAMQRMALLAGRALECARDLEPAHRHELIVAAMASFYLSAPEARRRETAPVTHAVLDVFGSLAWPALAIFRGRRRLSRIGRGFEGSGGAAQGQSISWASSAGPSSIRALRSIGS
jgi:tetraprenyl-beta-curcumene synthase